jgi:hypothetical protein
MKLQATVLFLGTAILAACSGSSGSPADSTSDDSVNCSTAKFQSCNTPSDCEGSLRSGETWGCTNDTPLSACNFAEPVCVAIKGSGPTSSGCHSASQCTGALPRNEERCPDGTFSGASWACRSEACVISYCEGHNASPSGPGGEADSGAPTGDGGGGTGDVDSGGGTGDGGGASEDAAGDSGAD